MVRFGTASAYDLTMSVANGIYRIVNAKSKLVVRASNDGSTISLQNIHTRNEKVEEKVNHKLGEEVSQCVVKVGDLC